MSLRKVAPTISRPRILVALIIIVFVIAGITTLLLTRAAGPFASLEPENGETSGKAQVVADSEASGGAAIKFSSTSPPSTGWDVPVTDGTQTYTVTSGDNTAALQAAMNQAVAANKKFVISGGIAQVSDRIRIPNAPDGKRPYIAFASGSGLRQTSIYSEGEPQGTLGQWGSMTNTTWSITGGTGQFSDTVTFSSTSGMGAGDWIWITSDDVNSHKNTKPGMLRKVVSISGNNVKIDQPLNRALSTTRKAVKMNLAQGAYVEGGIIEHAQPLKARYNLVRFDMVIDPQVNGMEIREGGASGIKNSVIYKGRFDLRIHDMKDDSSNIYGSESPYTHYGYGVEDNSSRETIYRLLEVYAVRHAYTTNPTDWMKDVEDRLKDYGDPEDVRVILLNAHDITSTGYNTHETGWNISVEGTITRPGRYRASGNGSGTQGGGGLFFRARRDHIRPASMADNLGPGGLTITDAYDVAIEVARAAKSNAPPTWSLSDGPIIQDVTIRNHHGATMISLFQRATIKGGVNLYGPVGSGIKVDSVASGSAITGPVRIEKATTPISGAQYISGTSNVTIVK